MEVITKPVSFHSFHQTRERVSESNTKSSSLPVGSPKTVDCYSPQNHFFLHQNLDLNFDEASSVLWVTRTLALRLEEVLRSAKKAHLSCGQVLLPPDLLVRIASDVVGMAETEPCGLRGMNLLLHFEFNEVTGSGGPVSIGSLRGDPSLPSTFQLHLSLKEEQAPWYSAKLPKILRSWTNKNRTLVVGSGYTLAKRKLYRSSS